MAIEHDPLGARALAREIREGFGGRPVRSAWLDRDRRRGGLRFEGGAELLFLLHPTAGHVLAGEDLPRIPARRSRTFRKAELLDARAPADERLLELDLGTPPHPPNWRLVAELHTNQWNLLILDLPEGEIGEVAWPREPGGRVLRPGARYRPPAGEREGAGEPLPGARWRELLEGGDPGDRRGRLLRNVAWTSGINAEWLLEPFEAAEFETTEEEEEGGGRGDPDPAGAAYRRYRSLLEEADDGEGSAWLLPGGDGPPLPYVAPLGREEARPVASLLQGMRRSAEAAGLVEAIRSESPLAGGGGDGGEEGPEGEAPSEADAGLLEILDALEEEEERLERRRDALRSELEGGADPEELRSVGHLLLTRKDRVPRGASRVELEGFDGTPREVELDPRLDAAGNARRYYDRAARRERARERVPKEIRRAEDRARRVSEARERLRETLRSGAEVGEERREELWSLAGGRPGDGGDGPEEDRLPYRVLRTASGLEVRVGRSAKDNEELTFHHSSPDDIWLHARQVPGSHVILRWGHREGNPPRKDLQEAAVAAATNSKARHSGTVGVDWTRRKYVRSPRKSPPGAVIPQRAKTVFVSPSEKLVKTMAAREEDRHR